MRKAIVTLLAFTVFTGLVSAHPFSMDMLYEENTDHLEQEANIYMKDVPKFLGSLVGDQTINANIESENSTVEVGIKMNGTAVQEIQIESYEEPTLKVNTTEKQLKNITSSEKPIQTLNQKLKNGDIEYGSQGNVNSLRTYIAEQLLTLSTLF